MLKILFMGTPEFSVTILDALKDHYEIVGVVTQPDKIGGRGHNMMASPVKMYAVEHNLPLFQPIKIKDEAETLINLGADLIVTAAYGQFVPEILLKAPRFNAINCHASLLPKYRGGSPIHAAIKNGDNETGVSIMYMERKMDAGDILSQIKIPILDTDNVGTMFDKLAIAAKDLLLETIPLIISGDIKPIKQDETQASFAYNITKEEEKVDFNLPARCIFNHIRAYNPFPIAYMELNGEEIKLYDSIVLDEKTNELPGTLILNQKGHLKIACGDNTVLEILSLKRPGKKQMSGKDFINGYVNINK